MCNVIMEYGPINFIKNSYDIYFDHPLDLYIEFDESQHFNQFRAFNSVALSVVSRVRKKMET